MNLLGAQTWFQCCASICSQVMSQAEGQQKNLVHSIDSLPTRGPLSCLDQDLLLLKATSAATLSCLGECLNILQQTQSHSQPPPQPSERSLAAQRAPSGESAAGPVPVLLLESPPPPSPSCLLSFQSAPAEPSPSGKVQLGPLDCDSCPCLMATMNFNVCSKCCWKWHMGVKLFHFVPPVTVCDGRCVFFPFIMCLFISRFEMPGVPLKSGAKYSLECEGFNVSSCLQNSTDCLPACMSEENQGLRAHE